MHKKSWGVAVASNDGSIAVALLSELRESGDRLREALVSLGAPVVYEAATSALDRAALERSQANVVVVNLDARNDPDLDEVYRLLDDTRYRVIFNEGDVSDGLTGWDHARWLRHLAAKVLGATDLDPPRPAGAQAVPVTASSPGAVAAVASADEAPVLSGRGADARSAVKSFVDEAPVPAPPAEPVTADVAAAAHDPGAPTVADAPAVPDSQVHALDDDPFDLDVLLAMPVAPPHSDEAAPAPPATAAPPSGEQFDVSAFDDFELEFGDDPPQARAADESIHSGSRSVQDDFAVAAFEIGQPAEPTDSAADGAPVEIDIEFDADAVPVSIATATPASAAGAHLDWSLEDIIDDPDASPAAPAQATDFGIEKMSAEEFLAPPDAKARTPVQDEPVGLSLELVPLEEAVAPTAVESAPHENWLDPDAAKVRRVWVLGASIGGPEAVREFLAAIPRDYPALFLLAQHLGEEFVDMMTSQLAQATPLTVRRAAHGERVGHGEVIVVPTSQRLRVDAQGVVVLERDAGETEFSPSIDRVLRDVADRFGAGAGAIVFSGMSSDAIEGCRHLASRGGTVHAQRPDTCVVSTMVDGVVDTGVVTFLGSPQELAARLVDTA